MGTVTDTPDPTPAPSGPSPETAAAARAAAAAVVPEIVGKADSRSPGADAKPTPTTSPEGAKPPDGAGQKETPPPPGPQLPPGTDPSAALVLMVETAISALCRWEAARNGLRLNAEDKAALKLQPDEKDALNMMAPFALPFIAQFLKYLPHVGAGLFALTCWGIWSDRKVTIAQAAQAAKAAQGDK